MDWFERLTGFKERGYEATQRQFDLVDGQLRSRVNGRSFAIGSLELPSLGDLRRRVAAIQHKPGRLSFRNIVGDVGDLHQSRAFEGALFQVASQFNMLEMVGPGVTPEQGVTRYEFDLTQGPACAIAAGAATIYRNYFVPIDGQRGQTEARQLDGLADLGGALAAHLAKPVGWLWSMQNGYALCFKESLAAIGDLLARINEDDRDALRALLRIGVHRNVEVTEATRKPPQLVSQAFCSALPVAYGIASPHWEPFARLVLEAAYEATLLAGALNAQEGGSNIVLLTQLGGGAFGNEPSWIQDALTRALTLMRDRALDVRLVSYGSVPAAMTALENAMR